MTSPANKTESNLIPETPTATEATWLAFTIAFAVFALIAVVLAFAYVFDLLPALVGEDSKLSRAERASAATPFLAACAAAVTFFAVMWRGAINRRQADEQRRQNDSTDEAELALLLDKAVGVLKSQEQADIQLGLAMLSTIALASNGRYATFALDLAIDTIVRAIPTERHPSDRAFLQIISVLSAAKSQFGRNGTSGTTLDFSGCDPSLYESERYLLLLIGLLPPCTIRSFTTMLSSESIDLVESRKQDITFVDCEFHASIFGIDRRAKILLNPTPQYIDCTFCRFAIQEIDHPLMNGWTFKGCDFSGAAFLTSYKVHTVTLKSCWHDPENPPYVVVYQGGLKHHYPVHSVRGWSEDFQLLPREPDELDFDIPV